MYSRTDDVSSVCVAAEVCTLYSRNIVDTLAMNHLASRMLLQLSIPVLYIHGSVCMSIGHLYMR